MSRPLSATTMYGKYYNAINGLIKKITEDIDIGLPETRCGRDKPLLKFKVETIARNGPCPVPRKHPPESSVLAKICPGK